MHIQKNFNRASSSYDSVAFVQKKCAAKLVNILTNYFPEFHPQSILDLGAGTGYIPEILLKSFPKSKYALNDISLNMLTKAKKKLIEYEKIRFILGDMEVRNFGFYDLTISNLAFQWVNNLKDMIERAYKNSSVLAFSCPLDGTFDEWSKIFIELSLPVPTYQYPLKQELENHLLALKPEKYFFDSQEFILEFANASEFIKYLKNLGANQGSKVILPSDLKQVIKTYTDKINITYKVFFGILSKCKSL
ncbi:methyltransferase domain-containing protein [Candidatus Mesenet endosymbiont of Agriotes lineatus]|uniref:methyltransferase domain-containing protein n=1 Tax=Candidatus Mesenet endosymbiont of Agriotes lineatus TaxID=3077948 RepID=UPI0030CE17FA